MDYHPGFSYSIRWADPEPALVGDFFPGAFGVCLYGDATHPAAAFAMDAATAEHPAQAGLADCQKVSFWFRLPTLRPYGEVERLFEQALSCLEAAGWEHSEAAEGYPDTGSSIGGLADTTSLGFWGKPEENFPAQPAFHGYNAAGEFVVVVEKPGTKPEFSAAEVEEVIGMAAELGRLVFGRDLPESGRV